MFYKNLFFEDFEDRPKFARNQPGFGLSRRGGHSGFRSPRIRRALTIVVAEGKSLGSSGLPLCGDDRMRSDITDRSWKRHRRNQAKAVSTRESIRQPFWEYDPEWLGLDASE